MATEDEVSRFVLHTFRCSGKAFCTDAPVRSGAFDAGGADGGQPPTTISMGDELKQESCHDEDDAMRGEDTRLEPGGDVHKMMKELMTTYERLELAVER